MTVAVTLKSYRIPPTLTAATKRLPKFRAYLVAAGAEMLEPTNPFEVLRVRSTRGVAVLYRKENGDLTWTDEMERFWQEYRNSVKIVLADKTGRGSRSKGRNRQDINTVATRDGWECFFCAEDLDECTASIEHLVPKVHGGPNHISNKFLACVPCNRRAGHMAAPEKIRLRDELRANRCSHG